MLKKVESMKPERQKTAVMFHARNDLYDTLTRHLFNKLRRTADEVNLIFIELMWPQVGEIHDLFHRSSGVRSSTQK